MRCEHGLTLGLCRPPPNAPLPPPPWTSARPSTQPSQRPMQAPPFCSRTRTIARIWSSTARRATTWSRRPTASPRPPSSAYCASARRSSASWPKKPAARRKGRQPPGTSTRWTAPPTICTASRTTRCRSRWSPTRARAWWRAPTCRKTRRSSAWSTTPAAKSFSPPSMASARGSTAIASRARARRRSTMPCWPRAFRSAIFPSPTSTCRCCTMPSAAPAACAAWARRRWTWPGRPAAATTAIGKWAWRRGMSRPAPCSCARPAACAPT
ncbi:Uncharacterised protein [Bordetella pertussis]|nr:Uncharacterised protein [Bordetella pertussis]CFO41793.1 Uncharacterised protein [Bordetella pertussis]CFP61993.1 Uncharacterised protein [Bordetella pertussis]CFW63688.1 Uncharacterised protein [Bordetella pertussis]CPL87867.1 Uncharacterised protein [Bordetella pertussis]